MVVWFMVETRLRLRLRDVTLWVYIALLMYVIALMIRVKWFYGFMVENRLRLRLRLRNIALCVFTATFMFLIALMICVKWFYG